MTHLQPFTAPFASRTQAPAITSAELGLVLLGPSSAMAQLWGQIRRLAPHVRTVLLTGEADCGQEAVARLLLDLSVHAHRTFVQLTAIDAEARLGRPAGLSSLPADLFLFLPDVDRFSLAAQDGILRLLRMRRSRPFTIVASTSEDLRGLVGMGRFSAALADALTAVRVALPSLRQRREDLPMLTSHLLAIYCQKAGQHTPRTTEAFLQAVMQHPWSGNLRELTNTLAALARMAPEQELSVTDLQRASAAHTTSPVERSAEPRLVPLETIIQEHIGAVLQACRGNKLRASEVLGISRSTLYRMLDTSVSPACDPLPVVCNEWAATA